MGGTRYSNWSFGDAEHWTMGGGRPGIATAPSGMPSTGTWGVAWVREPGRRCQGARGDDDAHRDCGKIVTDDNHDDGDDDEDDNGDGGHDDDGNGDANGLSILRVKHSSSQHAGIETGLAR